MVFVKCVAALVLLAVTAQAAAADHDSQDYDDGLAYDEEGRLLIIPVSPNANGNLFPGFNLTNKFGLGNGTGILGNLLPLLALGVTAAMAATALGLSIAALANSFYTGTGGTFGSPTGGFTGNTGFGTGSSYSSYRRSFDPYAIDWEKFSIIDWIAIGEETWRKFDPSDLECQKRLICEVHQNIPRFGFPAQRLVDIFSYLQYAEVLSLPDEIKALIEEYNDAADRGRSMQKECADIYTTCDFSVKKIMDKYSHNEV